MRYGIIGTGNIAWWLATKLSAAGHECAYIYSRNAAMASELAAIVKTKVLLSPEIIEDGDADICIIALSDNVIADVAELLAFKKTVLIHTAGSVAIDVLKNSAVDYGVLWPLYSILKNKLPDHKQVPCAWEASSAKAEQQIKLLAENLSDTLQEAKEAARSWLHLSAVISNNFTNHLVAICQQLCAEHNLPFTLLQPIIAQTFERIKEENTHNIQTGPARRGDSATIDKHLHMLAPQPEWQDVYNAITASIKKMYNVNTAEKDAKP